MPNRSRLALAVMWPLCVAWAGLGCGPSADLSLPEAKFLGPKVGILVTSTDFSTSTVESIDAESHEYVLRTSPIFDGEPRLRALTDSFGKNRYFVVNSRRERVTEVTSRGGVVADSPVARAESPRGQSNPRDVAMDKKGRLWVTRYGLSSLAVLSSPSIVGTPRTLEAEVELKDYADEDGKPEMDAVTIVGNTAYVTLQRLSAGCNPKNVSQIVAIDVDSLAVTKLVDLPNPDPSGRLVARSGPAGLELWVASIAAPIATRPECGPIRKNAALLKVDVAKKSVVALLPGETIGGFVPSFQVLDNLRAYAIVAEFDDAGNNPTRVVRFDPTSGNILATWATTSTYKLWDVAAVTRNNLLLVLDRTIESPGIRVLSLEDGSRVGFIPTRMAPYQIAVINAE